MFKKKIVMGQPNWLIAKNENENENWLQRQLINTKLTIK
jgi:hypothetical protein